MERQKEHHRLYHGTLRPGVEINLPVNARRRQTATQPILESQQSSGTRTAKNAPLSKEQLRNERLRCHWCQLAKFSRHDQFPISISNNVDSNILPANFEFIERSIFCEGVEAAEEAFRTGCECGRDQECERKGCTCLQDMGFEQEDLGPRTKVYSYLSRGVNKDCLRLPILESRDPIYECHDKCQCSIRCNNRVVERGRKVPLEIFRTSDGRGWGVRSSININQGQYVDKYVGEIITSAEAQRRRQESDVAQKKDVYLFALDKFSDEGSMDPRLAGPPFEVDGEFKSGPTRFINHSCRPNLRSFARVGDHADKHLHDLALFAIRDIPAGEELTFDYVDGVDVDMEDDLNDPQVRRNMETCLCGSEDCRGYLW